MLHIMILEMKVYSFIIVYRSFINVVLAIMALLYDRNNLTMDFITLSQLLRIMSIHNYLTSFPLHG